MFFLNISVFLVVIVLHIFLCLFVVTATCVDLKVAEYINQSAVCILFLIL